MSVRDWDWQAVKFHQLEVEEGDSSWAQSCCLSPTHSLGPWGHVMLLPST